MKNVKKCSSSPGNYKPIFKKVVHTGGKIMHQVLTLRKTLLIFGFVLVFIGCSNNKTISQNDTIGLTAEIVPEGIRLTLDPLPPEVKYAAFYFMTEGENRHGLITELLGTSLEEFKETRTLVCPFVQNGLKYTVTAYVHKNGRDNTSYSTSAEIIAENGILIVPNGITFEFNETKTGITYSAFPEFYGDARDIETKYSYSIWVDDDPVRIYAESGDYDSLAFDFSTLLDKANAGSYVNIIVGIVGVELKNENVSWMLHFGESEDPLISSF